MDIFKNVQLVMDFDDCRIHGLSSLIEEMEKKTLTADAFNYIYIYIYITVFILSDPFLAIE